MIDASKVWFDRDKYQYFYADQPLSGVSKFLNQFKSFDADAVAAKQAAREGRSKGAIKMEWKEKRDKQGQKGTRIHEIAQELAQGRSLEEVFCKNQEEQQYATQVARFLSDHPHIIINATERRVVSPSLGLIGQMDATYLTLDGQNILDWKISEHIRTYNPYGETMRPPVDHLDDCHYNHYALQLSLYQYILETEENAPTHRRTLVWLQPETYQLFQLPYLWKEIEDCLAWDTA